MDINISVQQILDDLHSYIYHTVCIDAPRTQCMEIVQNAKHKCFVDVLLSVLIQLHLI